MTDSNDTDTTETDGNDSRRGFLTKSALAGGALLTLGGGAGVALADEHTTEDSGASFDDVAGTDIDVLNYALSLEQLESAFYEEALDTFDQSAFGNAEMLSEFEDGVVYGYVETLAEHERQHVETLTGAIELLGGDPVQPAAYDFGFGNVEEFLSTAQVLENTGVAAYAGAAPFVESPDLLGTALSIHSVEARHAAVLNNVNGASPFPDVFDPASSQSAVLDAVSQFLEGEPEPPTDEPETPMEGNETETPTGNETETPFGNETETPMGNETETPFGNETETPMGNETETPFGNGTDTPSGD